MDIDFKTYTKRITPIKAATIAGYIKPILPMELSIPALVELDRYFWTDKEMRASKGRWEKKILIALNRQSSGEFRKRMFKCEGEDFEIDAAFPTTGQPIQIANQKKEVNDNQLEEFINLKIIDFVPNGSLAFAMELSE